MHYMVSVIIRNCM